MRKPTNAARLAKQFSKRADGCRKLAEVTSEPHSRSAYLGMVASYEAMAAALGDEVNPWPWQSKRRTADG